MGGASDEPQDGTILIRGMQKDTQAMLSDVPNCPIRNVLDQVGDKWSLLVLVALSERRLRFMELKRIIGDITQRVLTQKLRNLERDGYVARKVHPTSPPTVEYWLTPLGNSLLEPLSTLISWANARFDDVIRAREHFDRQRRQPGR
jgi:DNA-binding HxlR family transcriptional regulator